EDDGHLHRHALPGHELLEVDVEEEALERVALDLADERALRAPVEVELDDGAGGADVREELVELAAGDGERLRLPAVAVDDGGNASLAAEGAGGALAALVARHRAQTCGGHA